LVNFVSVPHFAVMYGIMFHLNAGLILILLFWCYQ